jgi:hypothetical protein
MPVSSPRASTASPSPGRGEGKCVSA